MNVLIDLQACQSESRFRGIGRYSLSLAKEMLRILYARGHTPEILLNSNLNDTFEVLKSHFLNLYPQLKIFNLNILTPSSAGELSNHWRLRASELIREHMISLISPDYLHVSTLIADGWGDNCVATVGELGVHIPTALTHYDMIPLVLSDIYMPPGFFRDHYLRKLVSLKKADLLLAISEYSRIEAIEWLERGSDSVVNISAAVEEDFSQISLNPEDVIKSYGLKAGYFLYVPGGFDPRKNIGRLIEAYSGLDVDTRRKHPLVIASKPHPGVLEHWEDKAVGFGLGVKEIIFTGYVPDDHLKCLYKMCYAYIFPSIHEGFGMPVLEAMVCGAPVIGSDKTSIPEVISNQDALFDPYSVDEIRNKLQLICHDASYLNRLKENSKIQPRKFSWQKSAELAVNAIENSYTQLRANGYKPHLRSNLPTLSEIKKLLNRDFNGVKPTPSDWSQLQNCFDANCEQLKK